MQTFDAKELKKIIKKIFPIIIVLFVAVCGYMGWNYYIGRPEYTVKLLQEAILKKDIAQIEKIVDIREVYSNAFDEAFSVTALTDSDEFTKTISSGLILENKNEIITKLVDATRKALGADVSENKIDHFGLFGKIISIMHENVLSKEPEIRFAGVSMIGKTETTADIQISFYGTKNKKQIPLQMRMYKGRNGEWQVLKILNMRKAYRASEFIIDKSYEEARLKAEAELARAIAERKKEEEMKVALPETQRQKASAMVRVLLKKNATNVFDNGNNIVHRFSSVMHGPQGAQLSLYNDVMVNKETHAVKNITSLIVLTNRKAVVDFDKLYFSSIEKGIIVDVNTWEEKGLASKMPIRFMLNGTEVTAKAFVAITDDFVDIYKLIFENILRVSLFQKNKDIGTFVSDDKVRKSIIDFMEIKNIIKDNLYVDDRYILLPASDEMLKEAETELQKKTEEKKKAEDAKAKANIKNSEADKASYSVNSLPQEKKAEEAINADEEPKKEAAEKKASSE